MAITDLIFLFCFLPICLFLYYVVKKSVRPLILLALSLFFYACGSPKYILLLIISVSITVAAGLGIEFFIKSGKKLLSRIILITGILYNVLILGYYKYTDFILQNINRIADASLPLKELLLPLGISFFTFKAISYLVDIYRQKISVKGKVIRSAAYLSFFAQMQSGPLARFSDMYAEEPDEKFNWSMFSDGLHKVAVGFVKKILIANVLAKIVNEVFAADLMEMSAAYAWLGAICFSLQLYYDFSGYSDMAIGIGNMLGFSCPKNFDYPYITSSVSEFWRRWHITLGAWFRDYIYFPLGGSRVKSKLRLLFNLSAVWLLTGIWHGADWSFIAWGLGYFILIAFEKLTGLPGRLQKKPLKILYRIMILAFIVMQWVMFRAGGFMHGLGIIKNMFSGVGDPSSNIRTLFLLKDNWPFILAAIVFCLPIYPKLNAFFEKRRIGKWVWNVSASVVLLLLFLCAVSFVVAGQNNPFLYANF